MLEGALSVLLLRPGNLLRLELGFQLLVQVADYGYTRPADATGLSDAYTKWRSSEIAASGDWVAHDVKRAAALLEQAGFALGPDGVRRDSNGRELRYEVLSVSGWSDWVRTSRGPASRTAHT